MVFVTKNATDGSRHTSSGLSGRGSNTAYGTSGSSTTAGPHSSNLANKADPRVDSDLGVSRFNQTSFLAIFL